RGAGEGAGQVLRVLAGPERPVASDRRVLVCVAQHGGGSVGVDDRDRLALAGHPGLGDVIGAANLPRGVAAVRPRLLPAVGGRLVGRDLLAVVAGAWGGDPVVRAGRRGRVGRLHLVGRGVKPADGQ